MNREFDIDNILAEIKIKKEEEGSPRQKVRGGAYGDPYAEQRSRQPARRDAQPDEWYGEQEPRSQQGGRAPAGRTQPAWQPPRQEQPVQRTAPPRQARQEELLQPRTQRAPQEPRTQQGQRSAQTQQQRTVQEQRGQRPAQAPQGQRTPQQQQAPSQDYYEEYEPIRPVKKAIPYGEEEQYEPASAIFELAHEPEKRVDKRRNPQQQEQTARYAEASHRGREREYREELPLYPERTDVRRGQQGAQPRYEKDYKPSYENIYQKSYEPEPYPEYEPAEQPRRSAVAPDVQPEARGRREPEYGREQSSRAGGFDRKNTRPQSAERFEMRLEDYGQERPDGRESGVPGLDYEAEYVGREAFEEPAAKKQKGFGRRRDEEEADDFIAKFSQVTPLGSRKVPRIDRDHVRGHFGEAESIAPKALRPKPYQRAVEPEVEREFLPRPELKGGFRMEPGPEYGRDDATRMDLPLAGQSGFEDTEFDDTRSLAPFSYEMDEELPPEDDGEPLYDDQPPTAAPLDEYETPDEAAAVRTDLAALRRGLMLRFSITAICTLCLLYLGLCQVLALPMPGALSPVDAPSVYAAVSVGLLAAAAVACHGTISGGITSLFTLRANNDSLAAVTTLACMMQGVAILLNPSALDGVQLYAAAAAIGLLMSTIGRLFTLGRVNGNFRFVSAGAQKYTVQSLQERELGRELTWDMNIEEAHVAYGTRTDFAEGFISQSYAGDTSDNIARISSPVIFLASIAVAVFAYVMGSDIFMTLSVFAAVLCIASPLTAAIVGSLPLHKAYRSLSKRGAVLSGYNAVERFADTNVVLADACDLFTSDEVLLHNIKTFAKTRIDDAILDAASVLCMCNGAVKNIFLRIIQGNTKMLKYVENIVYEDAMGISAWVSGKRVLIGNSDLMKHHGIDTPSRDYEAKYRTEDRDILYLANSGELTAMFVISYVANRDVDEALVDLGRKGISVVVRSVDPNLTAGKIARIYDLPEEMIRILPAKLHMEYESLCGADRDRDECYIAHNGTFLAFARAVSAAGAVRVATNIGLIVQTVGMVLGYALVTFFSFMGAMEQAGLATVLVFQTIWSAAVWLFAGARRV